MSSPSRNADQPGNSRIGDGTQPPKRPLLPSWIRLLLYPVFALLLLIPALRRLRRETGRWNRIRLAAAALAMIAGVTGAWWGMWWLAAAGSVLLAMSWFVAASPDPDHERDLQRRHRADYLLNGGKLLSSWPAELRGNVVKGSDLQRGAELYLLLRAQQVLLVPVASDEIGAGIDLADIQEILVGGEVYQPVYISEAKDPPVREKAVDRKAAVVMTLLLAGGAKVDFVYQGAFSKHLAGSAAHALYSVRKLGTAHGVPGQSPEVFHVVGR